MNWIGLNSRWWSNLRRMLEEGEARTSTMKCSRVCFRKRIILKTQWFAAFCSTAGYDLQEVQ